MRYYKLAVSVRLELKTQSGVKDAVFRPVLLMLQKIFFKYFKVSFSSEHNKQVSLTSAQLNFCLLVCECMIQLTVLPF